MVVSDHAGITPAPSDEALRQLRLRYRPAAQVGDSPDSSGQTPDEILTRGPAEATIPGPPP